jgi:hypothetical protein
MEHLILDQLKGLAQHKSSPSVSIYLPTHRAGQDIGQDPIRFKNLLRQAERTLLDRGMRRRSVEAFLRPARALLDDTPFWSYQQDGLAVLFAADDFHTYHLPFRPEELLVVAQAYYVKPVLPLFTNNGHYFILAISQQEVRLFEGTRHSVGQIELPDDTPQSLDEALVFDDPEKQLQFRTGTSQGGMRDGVFHGHGPGDEEQKVRIERYLNLVDAGLRQVYREQQAPLVLAGVDYLLPIYRQVSEYAHVMEEGIPGSPEHLRPEELQARAWPIVEPHFRKEMEEVLAQYQALAGTGRTAQRIEEIVPAAFYGRVDKLVLAVDTQIWGIFDPQTGEVAHSQDHQGEEDDLVLSDFAAMQTLLNGGTVFGLSQGEMPGGSSMIAILRYS